MTHSQALLSSNTQPFISLEALPATLLAKPAFQTSYNDLLAL
jgi:hypothetical protein